MNWGRDGYESAVCVHQQYEKFLMKIYYCNNVR